MEYRGIGEPRYRRSACITKFFFKQMLKISAFYLVKQKSVIPKKKKYDLGRCQYPNKKALFTDPIFSDGFGSSSLKYARPPR